MQSASQRREGPEHEEGAKVHELDEMLDRFRAARVLGTASSTSNEAVQNSF